MDSKHTNNNYEKEFRKENEEVTKLYKILTRDIELIEENVKLKKQLDEQLKREKVVRNELRVIKDFNDRLFNYINQHYIKSEDKYDEEEIY
ncbi:hypothetical protein ODY58_06365 [Aerococcus sp. JJEM-2022b]|uniref:hypothetical protein n=1 Tax=Aerococcus mictus TaxID=2976810 RepID=UPI00227CF575|nr:hypothetical protein [Aerococcus mictus]MCY3078584.1 hypothetical protein [Aerococcus mictus]